MVSMKFTKHFGIPPSLYVETPNDSSFPWVVLQPRLTWADAMIRPFWWHAARCLCRVWVINFGMLVSHPKINRVGLVGISKTFLFMLCHDLYLHDSVSSANSKTENSLEIGEDRNSQVLTVLFRCFSFWKWKEVLVEVVWVLSWLDLMASYISSGPVVASISIGLLCIVFLHSRHVPCANC